MRSRALVISMLVTAVAGLACSRTVELSGDVAATSPSGETKRIGDVEVTVFRATDRFEQEHKEQVERYQRERAHAAAFYRDKRAVAEKAKQAADEAHQAAAQSGRLVALKVYLERANRLSALYQTATREMEAARETVQTIDKKHHAEAMDRLQAQDAKRVRADGNGHFTLGKLPRGKYYVYVEREISDKKARWLVPVDANDAASKVELSSANMGWPFDPPKS